MPGVPRRTERRVLGGRAHRELVHVRLADDREPGLLAARRDGRVEDRDVPGEDLRPGRRRNPLGRDEVLVGDRDAAAVTLARNVEVGVEFFVALRDRGQVGIHELGARDLSPVEQVGSVLGC
jgi:hypothetical protein